MRALGWCWVVLLVLWCQALVAQSRRSPASLHALEPAVVPSVSGPPDDAFVSFLQFGSAGKPTQPVQTGPRRIHGQIRLSGQKYKTTCDCHTDEAHTCHQPKRMRVHKESANRNLGFSRKQLRQILGRPSSFEMASVEKTSLSCLDGRNTEAIFGTPGGDFGEFLNGLQVVEDSTGKPLTLTDCEQALRNYLKQLDGRLFYCTDEDAVSTLQRNVKVNGQRGRVVGLKLQKPKNAHKEGILAELGKEPHQGDYYLKAVLADPGKYYFRKQLVVDALKAMHQVLWDKKSKDEDQKPLFRKINMQIYEGEPKEKTWINFRANAHCESEHRAPLFAPQNQVWANHPEAASVHRKKLAKFLVSVRALPFDETALWQRLNRRGRRTMELYAESRALAVAPFYTVTVE